MVSSMISPSSFRIPDAVHPPIPGETHRYYGNIHNKQVKLPSLSLTFQSSSNSKRTDDELDLDIHEAAAAGNLPRVQELLDPQGAAETSSSFLIANETNPSSGLTPLHYAASRGHLEVVKYLVDTAGCIVDLEDPTGETALLKASYSGHSHVVAFLLLSNADVELKDSDGWTALHNASAQGHLQIVKYLLEHTEADINVKSNKGHTPLMNAASKGHIEIVEYLLKHKANPFIKNDFGEAAYDVAAISQMVYVCEILDRVERECWKSNKGILPEPTSLGELTSMPALNQPYDVLAFHINVPVVLHENQRASSAFPILRGPSKYTALLRSDVRGPWSLPNGKPTTKDEVRLPSGFTSSAASVVSTATSSKSKGWFWVTEWEIDFSHPRVDSQGWQYARSFDEPDLMWIATPPTSGGGWVRRRRWVRVMKRRIDPSVLLPIKSNGAHQDTPDYIGRAERILNKDHSKGKAVNGLPVSDELIRYKEAISILLAGIKSDSSTTRKDEASALVTTFLQHAEYLQNIIDGDGTGQVSTSPSSRDGTITPSAQALNLHFNKNAAESTTSLNSYQTLEGDDVNGSLGLLGDSTRASASTSISTTHASASSITSLGPWENDDDVHECRRCHRKFALWIRRHHCRRCGQVVCDKCSTARVNLPSTQVLYDPSGNAEATAAQSTQFHRVCDACYAALGNPPVRQRSNSFTAASIISATSSSYRHRRRLSNSSTMTDCPGCGQRLSSVPGGQEEHLKTCLENRNGNNYTNSLRVTPSLGKSVPFVSKNSFPGKP